MTTPAYEIAQYLHSRLFGVFAGQSELTWSINVSQEPAQPNQTITVYDQGGGPKDTDELDLQNASIQIRVRSKNYLEGYDKLEDIATSLTDASPLETETLYFVGVEMVSNISHIGRDDNDRHLFVANFELLRQN
jgi:hypothetical protein